jgi:6-phosphogluconolactonase
MTAVRRFPDLEAQSRAAAAELIELARAAVAARGRCHVALAGGATPKRMFQLLGEDGSGPWDSVHLWWTDERCVEPHHPDSNYRLALELMIVALRPSGLAEEHVHRMHGELDPGASARAYEDELCAVVGDPPVLDYVLLGMGPDGHTASLFPDSPALAADRRWVVANPVRSPLVATGAATRLTLTAPAINRARHVRFLVAGADKAAALAAVLEGPRDPRRYPAQLVEAADLAWLVDEAAAARLGGGPP